MKKYEIVSMGQSYQFQAETKQQALAEFFKKVVDGKIKHSQLSHSFTFIGDGQEWTMYPAPILCVLGLITEDQAVQSLKVMIDPQSKWPDEWHKRELQKALDSYRWIVKEIRNSAKTEIPEATEPDEPQELPRTTEVSDEEIRKSLSYFDNTEPTMKHYLWAQGKSCCDCDFADRCFVWRISNSGTKIGKWKLDCYMLRCPIKNVQHFFDEQKTNWYASSDGIEGKPDTTYRQTEEWKKWIQFRDENERKMQDMIKSHREYDHRKKHYDSLGHPSCFGEMANLIIVGHEDYCPADCEYMSACRGGI